MAGDWTATGLPASMESASRSAAMAAEEVAASLGHRLKLAEPVPDTVGSMAWLRRRKESGGALHALLGAVDRFVLQRPAHAQDAAGH